LLRRIILGSGALVDKLPLLAIVNDEFDCSIGISSVIIVGVVGVTADGEETAAFFC